MIREHERIVLLDELAEEGLQAGDDCNFPSLTPWGLRNFFKFDALA